MRVVVGPPGAGKTSLCARLDAMEVPALGPAPERADGVVVVLIAGEAVAPWADWLAVADVVLVNHADRAAPDLDAVRAHTMAPVYATVRSAVDLDVRRRDRALPPLPDLGLDRVTLVHDGPVDPDALERWLLAVRHQAPIARITGWIAVSGMDRRLTLEGVGGALDVLPGAPFDGPPDTRLTLLGPGLAGLDLPSAFRAVRAGPRPVGAALDALDDAIDRVRATLADRAGLRSALAVLVDAAAALREDVDRGL